MRVAVLTISDRAFRGEREDRGGPALEDAVARQIAGARVVERRTLPDERIEIAGHLKWLADADRADLILTTGGTGLGPRDVTPQATRDVLDYEVPGLGEAMRAATRAAYPTASLSRQLCGVRASTLILNLPGSPRGAVECFEVVANVLAHAVATLRGPGDVHPERSAPSA